MANKKPKRNDGRMQKVFRVDGVQYCVCGRSAAELFEKEKAKREEIARGFESRDNPTLAQYYERWNERRSGAIKESTQRGQIKMAQACMKVHIPSAKRVFGDLRLKEIKIDDLYLVQSELAKTRHTQTVNDYLAHMNHCFSDALKERVIEYNPFCLLNNLKRTEEKARDTHHRALSLDEQTRFFECERCKSSFYRNVYRFAISTGMRAGEIGALRYSDIRQGMIHVERTITRTENGAYIVGDSAKTAAGKRQIPLTDHLKSIIVEQKAINELLDGNVLPMDDLIFKAPERGLLMSTPIDREIKRICKVCEIEPFTMHAFRATFATRCIESGVNPKTLQEILGHSNFNITMSLYGHCLADTKKQDLQKVIFAV